jgi:ribonuclease G
VVLNRELLIQSSSGSSQIALLEDQRLTEFHEETQEDDFLVGDIYYGTVRKTLQGLNAAFIDIGHEKDAFLHYLDLGPNFPTLMDFVDKTYRQKLNTSRLDRFKFKPELDKEGKITDVLQPQQNIAVQLMKEPISTKGPRLSCELTLAGRLIILIPFKDTISISKQVRDKNERARLKKVIAGIKPKNFGVIVRTVATDKPVKDIEEDLNNLLSRWDQIFKNLKAHKQKLYGEANRASTMLRDLLNESFNRIVVDNNQKYSQLKEYINQIDPKHTSILTHYKGDNPVFNQYTIDRQIKSLFGKTVNIGGGAYLVIEHTEAMHVIDVNSGSKRTKNVSQEENALKTNLEATDEIARQLRLRDMGGIIVLDFIDMKESENRKRVYDHMQELLKRDRAKHSILPISKFGIMQITRQRVRPEITISTAETCPVCKGKGEVNPSILLVDQLEQEVANLIKEGGHRSLTLKIHPFLHSYLTCGILSKKLKWIFKYKTWIRAVPEEDLYLNIFYIEDQSGQTLISHQ